MDFQLPTKQEDEQMSAVLWNELKRVYIKGWYEKHLTLQDIAGRAHKNNLSRALNHGRKPEAPTLYAWCEKWYDAEIIDDEEATHIMHLAGYVDAREQRKALQATHARIVAVDTQDLPPCKHMGPTTDKVVPGPITKSTIRSLRFPHATRLEKA